MTISAVINDPPVDSLFEKVDVITNACTICGEETYNNTEARDAHLNEKGCHVPETKPRRKRARR